MGEAESASSVADKRAGFFDPCKHDLDAATHACKRCGVPLSSVSGMPMRPVPFCEPADQPHEWAPELHYATSFGLVLFCKRCGFAAQAEIVPLPSEYRRKSWRKARERRALAQAKRWGYCKKWDADGYPRQANHHRWPDRITVGPVLCQRCQQGATVARIYAHPGGDGGRTDPQVWVKRYRAVVAP